MTSLPIEAAQWIQDTMHSLTAETAARNGVRIADCIPPKFESYCKLLHPFERELDGPPTQAAHPLPGGPVNLEFQRNETGDILITLQGEDGAWIDLAEEHRLREAAYRAKRWEPLSWEAMAQQYGLSFHPEISPRAFVTPFQDGEWPGGLNFPSEGLLLPREFRKLLDVLEHAHSDTELCLYQVAPHTTWRDNKVEDHQRCSYEEAVDYFKDGFRGYLYAPDHSWIVYTDSDLCFTLIGGPRELVEAMAASGLEVLSCSADTRVDYAGDQLNPRPRADIAWEAARRARLTPPLPKEAPQQKRSPLRAFWNRITGKK